MLGVQAGHVMYDLPTDSMPLTVNSVIINISM